MDGEEGSSERCFKWGGGGWGVIKGSFHRHLKTGVGKGKLFVGGGGFEGVTTPVSPPVSPPHPKILIVHFLDSTIVIGYSNSVQAVTSQCMESTVSVISLRNSAC